MILNEDSTDEARRPKSSLQSDGIDIEGAELVDIVAARPFNQRIDVMSGMGAEEGKVFLDTEDDFGEDEELTREKIKQASAHTLQIEKKKKKIKGGRSEMWAATG